MHERFNNTDARNLFKGTWKKDPKTRRPTQFGPRARQRDGFDSKALEYIGKAWSRSEVVEARELKATLLLEDSYEGKAFCKADEALEYFFGALDAMGHPCAMKCLPTFAR